jgi:hypothetical protein
MSALPPKADMFSFEIDVCLVPIADMAIVEAKSARSSGGQFINSPPGDRA